jgi:D-xylose transport system substrate-binding protein
MSEPIENVLREYFRRLRPNPGPAAEARLVAALDRAAAEPARLSVHGGPVAVPLPGTTRRLAFLALAVLVIAAIAATIGLWSSRQVPVATSPSPTASATTRPSARGAGGCKVGVSVDYADSNYALWEAPAINLALAPDSGTSGADAKSSSEQQAADIDAFVAQGMDVIVVKPVTNMPRYLAGVPDAVKRATDAGIPVIVDEGILDDPNVLHIGFDLVEVGRLEARAILAARPKGNYVIVKGPADDYYAEMVGRGIDEELAPAIASGAIKVVGEVATQEWFEGKVQPAMDEILRKNQNRIDAVIVEGDFFVDYVAASLKEAGLEGKVALAGDYSFPWRLRAVAAGAQTADVWRDYTQLGRTIGETANALCRGGDVAHVSGTTQVTLADGHQITSILHTPRVITRDTLNIVLDSGWMTKDELCQDLSPATAPAVCQ